MSKVLPALMFCITLLLPANAVLKAQERDLVPWARDFREATEFAARQRKLVLLHFWSDDCPPCKRVEANVFTQPVVATTAAGAFVPVKVHVEREPELARRYQVTRWPTDVIVNPAGLEVFRTVSPQDPVKYVAMLNEVAAQSGTQLARAPQPAASEPIRPATAVQPVANQPPPGPQAAPYQPLPNPKPMEATPPADPYANRVVNNPYTLGAGPTPTPRGNNAGGDFVPADSTTTANLNPGWQHGYCIPSGQSDSKANSPNPEYAPVKQEPSPKLADAAIPANAPELKREAPPALPSLGMEGYCVVTLADQTAWKKGDKKYGAIHRGKLYLFLGEAEQQKFLADPDRFSPALSGCDPVQFTDSGKFVDGKRAHGLTYNRQMYLFADEASLQKFQGDPRRFADTVYQAQLRTDGGTKLR